LRIGNLLPDGTVDHVAAGHGVCTAFEAAAHGGRNPGSGSALLPRSMYSYAQSWTVLVVTVDRDRWAAKKQLASELGDLIQEGFPKQQSGVFGNVS